MVESFLLLLLEELYTSFKEPSFFWKILEMLQYAIISFIKQTLNLGDTS